MKNMAARDFENLLQVTGSCMCLHIDQQADSSKSLVLNSRV
jgi:hypothetical protein